MVEVQTWKPLENSIMWQHFWPPPQCVFTLYYILHNSTILQSNYFMLLGRPWLKDAKVTHDWGNNMVIIQGNGLVKTIVVT